MEARERKGASVINDDGNGGITDGWLFGVDPTEKLKL